MSYLLRLRPQMSSAGVGGEASAYCKCVKNNLLIIGLDDKCKACLPLALEKMQIHR